jgi:predicted GNAT family N-acyltransferase
MTYHEVGPLLLQEPLPNDAYETCSVRVVRDLSDFQMAACIRAAVFMSEQNCPYEEEFDGNDFTGTHLLAFVGRHPVGTLRLRWFADFVKVERACILPAYRHTAVVKLLMVESMELAARKGYNRAIAQIQARLWPLWSRTIRCVLREERTGFTFSDYEYVEVSMALPRHPRAITADGDPYIMIRPEGDWDRPGVLERSSERPGTTGKAA